METIRLYQTLNLISPDSLSLNDSSEPIPLNDIASPEIQALIDRMLTIGKGEQGNPERPTMVGLAAPQLGVNKRIILVGIDAEGNGKAPQLEALINPVITYRSHQTEEGREGCYSTGRVCGIVGRAATIHLRAYNRFAQDIDMSVEGFPARIFQHEIDHLDGIRFPDRITDPSHLHWVPAEQFGAYREQWATWNQYCPRDRWQAIRDGRPFTV